MKHKPNAKQRRAIVDFGQRLGEALVWREMTQTELAQRMGITRAAVSLVINYGTSMPAWRVRQVCEILKLDANWLLGISQ